MRTDYDRGDTATQYKEAKRQPWRFRVETYSFVKQIGDIKGKRVLDAACGAGHFTRILRQAGAEVVGIDISEQMIALAREHEAKEPLGIEYRIEDVRSVAAKPEFDLVVSAWVLVYAQTDAELAEMCRGLASRVKPGGRFVTYTTNPGVYHFRPQPDYRKYGFTMKLQDHAYDGAPINFTIHLEGSELEIENYYLPIATYEAAYRDAGFRDFAVHKPELEPSPDGRDDSAFWADFLNYPMGIMIDARKA